MKQRQRINWQPRMKLTPEAFRQTEDFFIEQLCDSRLLALRKFDYGLLPQNDEDSDPGILIREHISDQIEVSLYKCNAITASGERICLHIPDNGTPLSKTFSPHHEKDTDGMNPQRWEVVLTVDPYRRIPVGELDPQEEPLRHPYCTNSYELHIIPSNEVNLSRFGAHVLPIGRIRKEGDRYVADRNYIPPCRAMSAHSELAACGKRLDNKLYDISKASLQIISKVNTRPEKSELAYDIRTLAQSVYAHLSAIHFRLKNYALATAPVVVTEYICTLAARCHTVLTCLPAEQKDKMLEYFYEWSDITPGSFETLLTETLDIEYVHGDLRSVMVRLETFVSVLCDLWLRLCRLEYIGQSKSSFIVAYSGGESGREERRGFMIEE